MEMAFFMLAPHEEDQKLTTSIILHVHKRDPQKCIENVNAIMSPAQ